MKFVFKKPFQAAGLSLLLALACAATARAQQDARLQLSGLDGLGSKANKSIDVTLDGKLLEIAKMFLDAKDPEEAAIRDLVGGLKGIYVRVFEFDREGQYTPSDVEALRSQLRPPGWTRTAGITSKREGENIEVYMMVSGGQVNGVAVIATSPKQFALVNIAGSLDLDKLIKLSGKFGIPSIHIDTNKK